MNIFIGNLAYTTTEEEVRQLFEPYGVVDSVNLITDRETGRLRGFGFVEMPDATEARAAIAGLNGTSVGGRPLNVTDARGRTRVDRSGGNAGRGGKRAGYKHQRPSGDEGQTAVRHPHCEGAYRPSLALSAVGVQSLSPAPKPLHRSTSSPGGLVCMLLGCRSRRIASSKRLAYLSTGTNTAATSQALGLDMGQASVFL